MSETIVYIPGRIKSAAKGGHVAGAEDIIDDDLQMTQAEINEIVLGGAVSVGLAATPSPVFVGESSIITLAATSSVSASSIKIKKGSTELASGSGTSLSAPDTITPTVSGSTTYNAVFQIGGMTKNVNKSVVAVYPIYAGAGAAYSDVAVDGNKQTARTSYNGTYNITNSTDAQYIWFLIPTSISATKPTAKMNGFDFPLDDAVDVTLGGVTYKAYKSSSTQDAGSFPIVLS